MGFKQRLCVSLRLPGVEKPAIQWSWPADAPTMRPSRWITSLQAASLVLSLAMVQSLHAQQIYRWSDPSGGVHFGDVPPPDGMTVDEVREVERFDAPSSQPRSDDYSIEAQVRRMESERMAREAERREAQAQSQEERIRQLEERLREAQTEEAERRASGEGGAPVYVVPPYRYRRPPYPGQGWDGRYPRPGRYPQFQPPHPRPPLPDSGQEDRSGSLGTWRRAPQRGGR